MLDPWVPPAESSGGQPPQGPVHIGRPGPAASPESNVYEGLGHISRQVAQLQAQVAELTRAIGEMRAQLAEPPARPSDQD
jgi:hypothetical protein